MPSQDETMTGLNIGADPHHNFDPHAEPYVFTTVRYDPLLTTHSQNTAASCNRPCPFYLLEHQWTRIQVATWSNLFHSSSNGAVSRGLGTPANFLYGLLGSVRQWEQSHPEKKVESLRIKVRCYGSGKILTEMWEIPRIPLSHLFPTSFDNLPHQNSIEWCVVLDTEPTEVTETTMFKTSDRATYARARAGAGVLSLDGTKEVLLYNTEDNVLDGSLSTPYFRRNARWVTPSASCGGQQGTTRRWALANGLCVEDEIPRTSLIYGEVMWISNAVRGYVPAVYRPRNGPVEQPESKNCRLVAHQLR